MAKINAEVCRKLFPANFLSLDEEVQSKTDALAKEVLEDNSWEEVFDCFNHYLRSECKTEDSVINFVCLFLRHVGLTFTIPSKYDSYDLVGFILSKVNLEKRWDDCGGEFDDFANEALGIDLMKDPYYQFWRDSKIIEISKKYGGKAY